MCPTFLTFFKNSVVCVRFFFITTFFRFSLSHFWRRHCQNMILQKLEIGSRTEAFPDSKYNMKISWFFFEVKSISPWNSRVSRARASAKAINHWSIIKSFILVFYCKRMEMMNAQKTQKILNLPNLKLVHVSCQSEGVNSRSLRLGWRCHRGQSCQSSHLFWRKTQNQTNPRWVGSARPCVRWNRSSSTKRCGQRWTIHDALCWDPNVGRLLPPLWQPSRPPEWQGSRRSRSGSCSVVVSGFPFPFPCAPAYVAANLILLAIIARRAMWQGSWEGGCMLWNALLLRCVAKEGHGSRPTCLFATWTWAISTHSTLEDSRLWQTGSHSGAGHSWPLIPPLFPRWGAMGLRETGQPTSMALHWMRLASARRGPTLNSVAKEVGPAWLCWPPRLEVDGAWRLLSSSPRWRMRGLSQSLPSSEVGWQLHGPAGGVQCLRVALPEPSLCLCWTDVPCRALVTWSPLHKRSCETTGSRSLVRLTSSALGPWRRCFFSIFIRAKKKKRSFNVAKSFSKSSLLVNEHIDKLDVDCFVVIDCPFEAMKNVARELDVVEFNTEWRTGKFVSWDDDLSEDVRAWESWSYVILDQVRWTNLRARGSVSYRRDTIPNVKKGDHETLFSANPAWFVLISNVYPNTFHVSNVSREKIQLNSDK